jgi:PPM family protein phosphatase
MIESYALTDIGCTRKQNQDRVMADHSLGLFAVADGMGGHQHGEIAAELALSSLRYYVESSADRLDATWPCGYDFELSPDGNRLSTAIQIANQQVWSQAQQSPECDGMGTTVAAILLGDGNVTLANVGDSRIYKFRYDELTQLSYDDTLINSMSEQGADPAELANHPMKNVLTQAAGSKDALNVHVVERELSNGDLYLICSDGLHGVIGNAAIRSILASGDGLEETARRLTLAARGNGGPDNISVVLLSYSY